MTPQLEQVRLWRPLALTGVVCLSGTTNRYVVDPNGEVVLGQVTAGAMLARRRREQHVVGAEQVCVWDASAKHEGVPYGTAPSWSARLIVLEMPTVQNWSEELAGLARTFGRRDPVLRDARFVRHFTAFHDRLTAADLALAAEETLGELLAELVGESAPLRSSSSPRDPALRRARDLLIDEAPRNITLRELAAVTGMNRHRLTRLFRAEYGMAPHRLQLASRISLARRLLERGVPVASVAREVGFVDQSHLHRHFRRTLGITPGRYIRLLRSNVQDARRHPP
jgi:AraC-like DNA-binding protein